MSTFKNDLDILQEFASMMGELLGDDDASGTCALISEGPARRLT
jgi:hypothetical protein